MFPWKLFHDRTKNPSHSLKLEVFMWGLDEIRWNISKFNTKLLKSIKVTKINKKLLKSMQKLLNSIEYSRSKLELVNGFVKE